MTEQAKSGSGISNNNANKQDVKVVKNVVQQKISSGSGVQVKSTILASLMPVRKLRLITSLTRRLALSGSIESKSSLESVIQSSTATSSHSEQTSAPIQGTSGVIPALELSSHSSTSSDHTLASSDHTLASSDHTLASLEQTWTSSEQTTTTSTTAGESSIPEPARNPIQVKPSVSGKPSLTAGIGARGPYNWLFTADTVIMSKSDNMFSSYDGAKGTTLAQLNYHIKPMIFAQNFP